MDRFLLGIFLSALSAPLSLLVPRSLKGRFVFLLTLVGSCFALVGVFPILNDGGYSTALSTARDSVAQSAVTSTIQGAVTFTGLVRVSNDTASTGPGIATGPGSVHLPGGASAAGGHPFSSWSPVLGLDPLSALFAALNAFIVPLVFLFADGYLRKNPQSRGFDSHYFFLPLFTSAMTFLYAAGDSLTFLFLWEVMTGASLILLLHDRNGEEPVSAGIYYLAAAGMGFGLLLTGFAVASSAAGGGLTFSAMAAGLAGDRASSTLVFALLACGFALKLGLVPLHTWLPRAHPAAPSHVSALMSALMVKAGLYGILRASGIAGSCGPWPFAILAMVGGGTAVLAILQAVGARDFKRMLAMSTVENAGIMALAVGTGLMAASTGHTEAAFMALAGGLMHAMSHGLSKGLAFLGAGAIYSACHTRDIEKLGGLGRKMPVAAGSTMMASASLCALPPFAGFPGELLIFLANFRLMAEWGPGAPLRAVAALLSSAAIAFAGACALSVFSRFFSVAFLGHPRTPEAASAQTPPFSCVFPMALLAAVILALGLYPQGFMGLVSVPVHTVLFRVTPNGLATPAIPAMAVTAMDGAGKGAVAILALVFFLLGLRRLILRGRSLDTARTWDCAYRGGTPAMQYTSASFSQPLTTLARPLMGRVLNLHRPEGFFPYSCSIETRYHDPAEAFAVEPAIRRFRSLLDRFSWIQGGDARSYIFYGLAFLAIALVALLGS